MFLTEGIQSSSAKVSSGVTQGITLSPSFFIIYINNVVDVIKHSTLKVSADDSKLQTAIKGHERLNMSSVRSVCFFPMVRKKTVCF